MQPGFGSIDALSRLLIMLAGVYGAVLIDASRSVIATFTNAACGGCLGEVFP
jgi:putative effector of murein hydrolase